MQVPGAEASPVEVVRAYVDALDARDFDTVEAINDERMGRFERTPTVTGLRIRHAASLDPGDPVRVGGEPQRYEVEVSFVYDGNGDVSIDDGRQGWGLYLARTSDEEPWRIVDQGSG